MQEKIDRYGQLIAVFSKDNSRKGEFKGIVDRENDNIFVKELPNFLYPSSLLEISVGNFTEKFSILRIEPYGNKGFGINIRSTNDAQNETNVKDCGMDRNTITATGNSTVIVGNDNLASFTAEITIDNVFTAIDRADATPEQKEEAKGILKKLSENPLLAASVSQVVPIIAKSLGMM